MKSNSQPRNDHDLIIGCIITAGTNSKSPNRWYSSHPFILLETIKVHGILIQTGSIKQPLHPGSRLMCTTNVFMNFLHGNSGLIRAQTF